MFTEYINTCTIPTFSQHCLFSLFSLTFISLVSDALSVSPSLLSSLFVYLSLQHSHYLSFVPPSIPFHDSLLVCTLHSCLFSPHTSHTIFLLFCFFLPIFCSMLKKKWQRATEQSRTKTTTNIVTNFFVAQLQEQAPEQDGSHGYGYNEIDQGKFSGRHADVDQDIYLRVAKNSVEKTEEISGWT